MFGPWTNRSVDSTTWAPATTSTATSNNPDVTGTQHNVSVVPSTNASRVSSIDILLATQHYVL